MGWFRRGQKEQKGERAGVNSFQMAELASDSEKEGHKGGVFEE